MKWCARSKYFISNILSIPKLKLFNWGEMFIGAGNQVALTVLDILHMLLVEDRVVAMKMNEVNAYLGPYIVQVLAPFFEQGFVEMIYGGLNEGRLLCDHAATKAIHLTGAASTFNRILWGSPDPKVSITYGFPCSIVYLSTAICAPAVFH